MEKVDHMTNEHITQHLITCFDYFPVADRFHLFFLLLILQVRYSSSVPRSLPGKHTEQKRIDSSIVYK